MTTLVGMLRTGRDCCFHMYLILLAVTKCTEASVECVPYQARLLPVSPSTLTGNASENSTTGLMQLTHGKASGVWYDVCTLTWDTLTAQAACRLLGFNHTQGFLDHVTGDPPRSANDTSFGTFARCTEKDQDLTGCEGHEWSVVKSGPCYNTTQRRAIVCTQPNDDAGASVNGGTDCVSIEEAPSPEDNSPEVVTSKENLPEQQKDSDVIFTPKDKDKITDTKDTAKHEDDTGSVVSMKSDKLGNHSDTDQEFKVVEQKLGVQDTGACPGTSKGNEFEGQITSPNYPDAYPANVHCAWLVKVPDNKKIDVHILDFNTTEDDFIIIHRGNSRFGDSITIKGTTTDGEVSFNESEVFHINMSVIFLEFYSDDNYTARGFKIAYKAAGPIQTDQERPAPLPMMSRILGPGLIAAIVVLVLVIIIAMLTVYKLKFGTSKSELRRRLYQRDNPAFDQYNATDNTPRQDNEDRVSLSSDICIIDTTDKSFLIDEKTGKPRNIQFDDFVGGDDSIPLACNSDNEDLPQQLEVKSLHRGDANQTWAIVGHDLSPEVAVLPPSGSSKERKRIRRMSREANGTICQERGAPPKGKVSSKEGGSLLQNGTAKMSQSKSMPSLSKKKTDLVVPETSQDSNQHKADFVKETDKMSAANKPTEEGSRPNVNGDETSEKHQTKTGKVSSKSSAEEGLLCANNLYSLFAGVNGQIHGELRSECLTPEAFMCPITKSVMKHPVVAQDGCTYERKAILDWLQKGHVSPVTGKPISDGTLRPNALLKAQIKEWRRQTDTQRERMEHEIATPASAAVGSVDC